MLKKGEFVPSHTLLRRRLRLVGGCSGGTGGVTVNFFSWRCVVVRTTDQNAKKKKCGAQDAAAAYHRRAAARHHALVLREEHEAARTLDDALGGGGGGEKANVGGHRRRVAKHTLWIFLRVARLRWYCCASEPSVTSMTMRPSRLRPRLQERGGVRAAVESRQQSVNLPKLTGATNALHKTGGRALGVVAHNEVDLTNVQALFAHTCRHQRVDFAIAKAPDNVQLLMGRGANASHQISSTQHCLLRPTPASPSFA